MVLQSRRDYMEAILSRYRKARRKEKSVILDEFCATSGITASKSIYLRPGVGDISERELRDPHIAFFAERNPEWRQGVELACLTEFSPENFQPAVWRFISKEASDLLTKAGFGTGGVNR